MFLHALIVVEELSHCGLACAACRIWTTFTASGEANLSKRIWREVERKAPPTKASAMSFSMQTRNERHRRSISDPIISPQTFVGTRFYPQRILITYNKVVYVSLLLHTQRDSCLLGLTIISGSLGWPCSLNVLADGNRTERVPLLLDSGQRFLQLKISLISTVPLKKIIIINR